jgi:hypothetical protein
MQMPISLPVTLRGSEGVNARHLLGDTSRLTPQSCNTLKKIACASAVAGCIATPNPVACILAVAPHCADCL